MTLEEELICAVERQPLIYNKTLCDYKSNNARENAWKEVSNDLGGKDIEMLKKRWRNLRDAFIKYHRAEKTFKSGDKGGKKKKWIYYDQMLFLIPHVEFKNTICNYDSQDENSMTYGLEENSQNINIDETDEIVLDRNTQEGSQTERNITSERNIATTSNNKTEHSKKDVVMKHKQPKKVNNATDDKLLDIITKPEDADEQFLLSCLPVLKRLSPRQNMAARIRIQQVLYQLEFGSFESPLDYSTADRSSRPSTGFSNISSNNENSGNELLFPTDPQSINNELNTYTMLL